MKLTVLLLLSTVLAKRSYQTLVSRKSSYWNNFSPTHRAFNLGSVCKAMTAKDGSSSSQLSESKHIKSEDMARGKWVALQMITYSDPTGKQRTWEGITRTTTPAGEADAVGIITLFQDPSKNCESVILVRQYRPPIKAYTIEFPAGLIDDGETASDAAIREMKEETGYTVTVKNVSPATGLDAGIGDTTIKFVTCEVNMDVIGKEKIGGGADEFTEVLIEPMNTLLGKLAEYSKKGDVVDSRLQCWAMAKAGQ